MAVRSQARRSGARSRSSSGASPSTRTGATSAGPRTGAKRTVVYYVKQLPHYLRLLGGLVTDSRVSILDKLIVAGAIAYIVMPIDLIPDFIPFFGEIDDVYILILALQRLISNAGRTVLLDHWSGEPNDLADINLKGAIAAAAFFLPKRIRRRLKVIGRA